MVLKWPTISLMIRVSRTHNFPLSKHAICNEWILQPYVNKNPISRMPAILMLVRKKNTLKTLKDKSMEQELFIQEVERVKSTRKVAFHLVNMFHSWKWKILKLADVFVKCSSSRWKKREETMLWGRITASGSVKRGKLIAHPYLKWALKHLLHPKV